MGRKRRCACSVLPHYFFYLLMIHNGFQAVILVGHFCLVCFCEIKKIVPFSIRYTSSTEEYEEGHPESICEDDEECRAGGQPDLRLSRRTWIDADYTDETTNPKVRNGVKMGEGDGTVSLLSLGGMCVEGWKRKRWNPGGIKITTVEVRFLILLR